MQTNTVYLYAINVLNFCVSEINATKEKSDKNTWNSFIWFLLGKFNTNILHWLDIFKLIPTK